MAKKVIRLYFERDVDVPKTATRPAASYEAGKWYDNVSEEHAAVAGSAAIPLTRDPECLCLLMPDGRAVVTRTQEKTVILQNRAEQVPEIVVSLEPHEHEE